MLSTIPGKLVKNGSYDIIGGREPLSKEASDRVMELELGVGILILHLKGCST